MKTLDEAIDYAQMIVPMTSAPDTYDMWSSIEYYLKQYREHLKWETYVEQYLAEEKKKMRKNENS